MSGVLTARVGLFTPAASIPSWLTAYDASALAGVSFENNKYYDPTAGDTGDCTTNLSFTCSATRNDLGNSSGVIASYASNVAAINNKGMLWENAETNYLKYTAAIAANWTYVVSGWTSKTDGYSCPDGGSNACRLVESSSSAQRLISGNYTSVSGAASYAVYAKLVSGSRYAQIRPYGLGSGKAYANYELSSPAVAGSGGTELTAASVSNLGGGWVRCILRANHASAPAMEFVQSNGTGEIPTYTGDGTSGIDWFAPLLSHNSTPGSLIATMSSTVTRAAPTVCKIAISNWVLTSGVHKLVIKRASGNTEVAVSALTSASYLDFLLDAAATAGEPIQAVYGRPL